MLAKDSTHLNAEEYLRAVRQSNGPVAVHWAGPPINQFRKSLGLYVARDQTLKPKMFYLGRDHERAVHKTRCLMMAWGVRRVVYNVEHWTNAMLQDAEKAYMMENVYAEAVAKGVNDQLAQLAASQIPVPPITMPTTIPAAERVVVPEMTPAALTLEQLVEQFIAYQQGRQVSIKRLKRMRQAFTLIYEQLPAATSHQALDRPALQKLTGWLLSRPLRRKTGRPLAVDTIRTTLEALRMTLDWADANELWAPPRRWHEMFHVRWTALLTPVEQKRAAMGKEVFTWAELKDLHVTANDRLRLFLLLGLNCAFGQGEIATLLRDDVDLETGVIDRIRHKTRSSGIRGRWQLWPETLQLLKRFMAPANEQGLALLSEKGRPLVDETTDTDSVALAWKRLLDSAIEGKKQVRRLSFGKLRKTSSDPVLRLSKSQGVQQQHLAHSAKSIAARHYTGEVDFADLDKSLRDLRAELLARGVLPTEKGLSSIRSDNAPQ